MLQMCAEAAPGQGPGRSREEPFSLGRACEARGTGQDGVLTQLGTVLQKETEPSSGTGSLGMKH